MNYYNLISERKEKINQIKSKNIFEKIKSKYIMKKVFDNLEQKILLNFIKYNNKIKKRIEINIYDYKLYSEIEIEIRTDYGEYGKFINYKKEDEKYYHIYFDNNEEEIKRNYIKKDEQINKIKIIIDYHIQSFEYLFDHCDCIKSIYFKKFYRNNINNMHGMFYKCSSLKELNLSNFN